MKITSTKSGFTTVKGDGFAVFNCDRGEAIRKANRILKQRELLNRLSLLDLSRIGRHVNTRA